MALTPFSTTAEGVVVRVSLTPKAGANRIDGVIDKPDGVALKVRVTAVPEKGKANAVLIKLVAKAIGIAPGRIALISGPKDRQKKLLIQGDAADVQARLAGIAQQTLPI